VGIGLAFTFQGWTSVSFFVGAVAAWALARRRPVVAAFYVVPVASGLIAGESLTGVLVAVLETLGFLH
jgi:uncharacterized oligopeptide transporter (OPT) family protein